MPDLDTVREEWSALAAGDDNIFATWEWASIWWRHLGEGRPLLGAVCRRADGTPVTILPLYLASRRPLRVMRYIGHGPADRLGPIGDPRDRLDMAWALRRALAANSSRWDVFVAEQLPRDQGWSALLGGRIVEREPSPVLGTSGMSWADLLASRSSNFREQVTRKERKLRREHDVRFRLTVDPTQLQGDLDVLFSLHDARWRGDSEAFEGSREGFHREFAACALTRGWLRLWILELDGVPAAAWYGFRFRGTESFYQSGRDPAWDRSAVGSVLLAHTVRQAMEDGVREYRFLRGGEPYKSRWADRDAGLETVALGRGLRGRAVVAAPASVRRLAAPLRQRLTR